MIIDYTRGNKEKFVVIRLFGKRPNDLIIDYHNIEVDRELTPWRGFGIEWKFKEGYSIDTSAESKQILMVFHILFFDLSFEFVYKVLPEKEAKKEIDKALDKEKVK